MARTRRDAVVQWRGPWWQVHTTPQIRQIHRDRRVFRAVSRGAAREKKCPQSVTVELIHIIFKALE